MLVFISPVLQCGVGGSRGILLLRADRVHQPMGAVSPEEGKNTTTKAPALKDGANEKPTDFRGSSDVHRNT